MRFTAEYQSEHKHDHIIKIIKAVPLWFRCDFSFYLLSDVKINFRVGDCCWKTRNYTVSVATKNWFSDSVAPYHKAWRLSRLRQQPQLFQTQLPYIVLHGFKTISCSYDFTIRKQIVQVGYVRSEDIRGEVRMGFHWVVMKRVKVENCVITK
jgi:hypothetical protein